MVFPSVEFLFYFFPIFLLCYVFFPFRNLTIIAFSILFYFWGEGFHIILLLLSVLINYVFGKLIASANQSLSLYSLYSAVFINLLILAYYKYFGFIVTDILGISISEQKLPLLPLGISFFTFQAISYLVDVYRRQAEPASSFFDLCLYITMFPQLIAGPIVRYTKVSRAIKRRVIRERHIRHGVLFFVLGLAQKVLIANNMAIAADGIYSLPLPEVSTSLAWTGSIAYMLQIYFDFAGYSNMAIGIGLIMGFRFPRNFNYPYIAQSITEFWQRWHISLSTWFRDYLYIPLGGNRNGKLITYRNLLIVFVLCGLWHGAAWTFIAWGAYYGFLLIIERIGFNQMLSRLPFYLRSFYVLFSVLIGWILFRSVSFEQAGIFTNALFGFVNVDSMHSIYEFMTYESLFFAVIGIISATPAVKSFFDKLIHLPDLNGEDAALSPTKRITTWLIACALYLFCITYIASGSYNPFIYFRF